MEMNANNFFFQLNNLCRENQARNIVLDETMIKVSKNIIYNSIIRTIKDAFLYFAAINYLNACIKIDKKIFSYSFKSKIEPGICSILTNSVSNVNLYYEKRNGILLLDFYNFIFSFHCVELNHELIEFLSRQRYISFDGIKKQCVGDLILEKALNQFNINNHNKGGSNNVMNYDNKKVFNNSLNDKNICSFNYKEYSLEYFINDFHLKELTTSSVCSHNVAIVIKELYLYFDLIKNSKPSLSDEMKRALYREIIIQSYSICETLEAELGRKYLNLSYDNSAGKRDSQNEIKTCREYVIKISDEAMSDYQKFKDYRNNVHLSKMQSIEKDPMYTWDNVIYIFNFMRRYIELMYKHGLSRLNEKRF